MKSFTEAMLTRKFHLSGKGSANQKPSKRLSMRLERRKLMWDLFKICSILRVRWHRTILTRLKSLGSQTMTFSKSLKSKNTLLKWRSSDGSKTRSISDVALKKLPKLEPAPKPKNLHERRKKKDSEQLKREENVAIWTGSA